MQYKTVVGKRNHLGWIKFDDQIRPRSDSKVLFSPPDWIQIGFLDLKRNHIRIQMLQHSVRIRSVVIPEHKFSHENMDPYVRLAFESKKGNINK